MENLSRSFLALALALDCWLLAAPLPAQQPVGSVTRIQKRVHVIHPGQDQIRFVQRGDNVLFLDTYETQAEARAKLLFEDDSLLTLGEKTRLQITENVYDPAKNRRSTTLKVLSGRMRVLVGRIFTGTGSKFEIHTPTAVAAARGTYFIIWLFEQNGKLATGVVSLADQVNVSNMDAKVLGTVQLGPDQYTVVKGGVPPTAASLIDPTLLAELLSSTELQDEWVGGEIPPGLELTGAEFETAPPTEASMMAPPVPPILQEPAGDVPVNVEIRFP